MLPIAVVVLIFKAIVGASLIWEVRIPNKTFQFEKNIALWLRQSSWPHFTKPNNSSHSISVLECSAAFIAEV